MRNDINPWPHRLAVLKRHGYSLFIGCLIVRGAFVQADSTALSVTSGGLPPAAAFVSVAATNDWLLDASFARAVVQPGESDHELVLDNGLLRRTFRLAPNAATIGVDNRMTGASVLRAVEPEALVTIDGKELEVGGLRGQTDRAYLLPEWVERLTNNPRRFSSSASASGHLRPRSIGSKAPQRRASWPPPACLWTSSFVDRTPRPRHITLTIHYELYDACRCWEMAHR
jgi:hypothetical protein